MKKLSLYAAILAVFVFTPAAHAASFPDVAENSEHYAAIEYLKAKGVVSGYPDGTFQPNRHINRAEVLKVLLLGTATDLTSNQAIVFPDVSEKDWFFTYVRKAYELKIIEGYPDGKFRPENNTNVAEALKIILLSFRAGLPPAMTVDPYPDVEKGVWYGPFAQYSKDKQIIMAEDDGYLHAEREVTRADFAEIVYRLMYIKEKNLDSFPLNKDWPTFTNPTDHYSIQYPFDWIKMQAGDQSIFWKRDDLNGQISFARIYPNSATVIVTVDPNTEKLTIKQYLAKLQYDASAAIHEAVLNDYPYVSVALPANGLQDFYLEMPNNTILIAYTQYGNGLLYPQLKDEIRFIIGSIRYQETTVAQTNEAFLSEVRKNLLVAKKGKAILDQISDGIIIETDTVGIGTGPIDYYYSAKYDITLKYDRNSDTLLAMKDGRTAAF